jgi:hypothetical protein
VQCPFSEERRSNSLSISIPLIAHNMVDFNDPKVIRHDFREHAYSDLENSLNPSFEQWQSRSSGMPWLASTCESA